MLGLLIGAGILGVIIMVMEEGDFPGWGTLIICVLAAVIPSAVISATVPEGLVLLGPVVGAVCSGLAISATCGMSVKRSCIAAGIFFACQFAISFTLSMLMS